MRFNPEDWKQKSHDNFEGAWHEGPSVLTPASHADTYPCRVYKRAKAHPVFATINRLRETYLSLGFVILTSLGRRQNRATVDKCGNRQYADHSDVT